MKVLFTKRAQKNYNSICKYLLEKLGESSIIRFQNKLEDFAELLSDFPDMGSLELPQKGIRGFQLTKQTRILYRIKGDQIIILALFDVRQNPKKKFK